MEGDINVTELGCILRMFDLITRVKNVVVTLQFSVGI